MAMENRYNKMEELAVLINELYAEFGEKPEQMPELKTGFAGLLDRKNMCSYIDELKERSSKTIEMLKALKLELWSSEQTVKALKELEIDITEEDASEYQLREKKPVDQCIADTTKKTEISKNTDGILAVINKVIAYRDSLFSKRDYISGLECKDEMSLKLIESEILETAKIMESMGVISMENDEFFDEARHCAVDKVITDDTSKHGKIFKVVRPGYSYNGEDIRVQEVVIYSA